MKKIFLLLFALLTCFLSLAQKTDYVWVMGNNVFDFNYSPVKIYSSSVDWGISPNSVLSDRDGKLLFVCSDKKLLDSKGNIIHTSKLNTFGSHNLIPYPCKNNQTLYFFFDLMDGKKVLNIAKVDNLSNDFSVIRTIKESNIENFRFVQQKNSNNIWFLRDNGNQIIIELITSDGFENQRILEDYYELGQSSFYSDGSMFLNDFFLVGFDNKNGNFLDLIVEPNLAYNIFSRNAKYIYSGSWPSANSDKNFLIFRKNISTGVFVEIDSNIDYVSDFKLGPDGIIYYLDLYAWLSVIKDGEVNEIILDRNVKKLEGDIDYYFPSTFHYNYLDCDDPCFGIKAPVVKWK